MPLESSIYKAILKTFKEDFGSDWCGFKTHGNAFQPGQPDIIGCFKGKFVGIETKQEGEEPTALQASVLRKYKRAGGLAGCAHNVQEALDIVHGVS